MTREERVFCARLHEFVASRDDRAHGRDVLFHRDLGFGDYPGKRTFDLALLGEELVVIFEAKAQQGFDTNQLDDFRLDRKRVQRLLGVPAIMIGIWSSRYRPRSSTESVFDGALHWSAPEERSPLAALLLS